MIGEKITGWTKSPTGYRLEFGQPDVRLKVEFPHYSTSIADAWAVVEIMFSLGWEMDMEMFQRLDEKGPFYTVRFVREINENDAYKAGNHSLPLLICLTALRALGHEA